MGGPAVTASHQTGPPTGDSPTGNPLTRSLLRYYGIRIGLFAAAVAVLMAVGLRGLWCIVLAFVLSGVISYPLARSQRQSMVRAFEARRQRSQR